MFLNIMDFFFENFVEIFRVRNPGRASLSSIALEFPVWGEGEGDLMRVLRWGPCPGDNGEEIIRDKNDLDSNRIQGHHTTKVISQIIQ